MLAVYLGAAHGHVGPELVHAVVLVGQVAQHRLLHPPQKLLVEQRQTSHRGGVGGERVKRLAD